MTREEFIKQLKKKKYSYEIEGDKLVVTGGDKNGGVDLDALTSLPPGVEFKNKGDVNLDALTGGLFSRWSGNIEGVHSKRLLNVMINKGLFEK